MNIQMPRFGAVTQSPVRFGNDEKARHAAEMDAFMNDVDRNLDQMTVVHARKSHGSQQIHATLEHPSGRYLGATLYYDRDNTSKLVMGEVSGSGEVINRDFPHPPGRNLFLENLRYNETNNPHVGYRSSQQPGQRVADGFTFWDADKVSKAKALVERVSQKMLALNWTAD